VAADVHSPPNSHIVVETIPIDADALAPRLPTIDASIYCIIIMDSWARMAGKLNWATRLI
jgi:hypothetical protein